MRDGLQHVFERWDGKGTPAGIAGEEIALSARIVVIADIVESFRRLGGIDAAVDVARRRAGGQFDPRLAEHVCDNAEALLGGLDEATGWDAAIAAEPVLAERMSGVELDDALVAIADFADLKSPYTTGHSRGVAERAASAALRAGWESRPRPSSGVPACCTTSAGSACPTRSGTSRACCRRPRWSACACIPT